MRKTRLTLEEHKEIAGHIGEILDRISSIKNKYRIPKTASHMKLIWKAEERIRRAKLKFDSELCQDFSGGPNDKGDALINVYFGKGYRDVIP